MTTTKKTKRNWTEEITNRFIEELRKGMYSMGEAVGSLDKLEPRNR